MGQYSDDVLDGTVCQVCGAFHYELIHRAESGTTDEWKPPGYPRTCRSCRKEARQKKYGGKSGTHS